MGENILENTLTPAPYSAQSIQLLHTQDNASYIPTIYICFGFTLCIAHEILCTYVLGKINTVYQFLCSEPCLKTKL